MEYDDDAILREICVFNGISCGCPSNETILQNTVHVLFSGLPKWTSFNCFQNLTELIIISQELTHIPRTETHFSLRKLWVCECRLKKIENLNGFERLHELYLYGNSISEMENLEPLTRLSVLWLNDNRITAIRGLQSLEMLTELNLSGNMIKNIGFGLRENNNLKSLYISGNYLSHPKDLFRLTSLPNLSSLCINEPEYTKNPICNNPNFPLILLHMFPKLIELDRITVDNTVLRHAITDVIQAKQSYYMMRSENEKTKVEYHIAAVRENFSNQIDNMASHTRFLDKTLRNLQISVQKNYSENDSYDINLADKARDALRELRKRVNYWNWTIEKYKKEMDLLYLELRMQSFLRQRLWQLELEMFGYVEVYEGTSKDKWFRKCSDLIVSMFCPHENHLSNVSGIKVLRVYRVINRILLEKFSSLLSESCDCLAYAGSSADEAEKHIIDNFFDYKFLIIKRPETNEIEEYARFMESGLSSNNEKLLTNCVNNADPHNLTKSNSKLLISDSKTTDLVVRFVLVRCLPNFLTACQVFKDCVCDRLSFSSMNDVANLNKSNNESADKCSCLKSREEYKVLKSEYFLPEFVIELQYLYKANPLAWISECLYLKENQIKLIPVEKEIESDHRFLKDHTVVICPSEASQTDLSANFSIEHNQNTVLEGGELRMNDLNYSKSMNIQRLSNVTVVSITHCQLQKIPLLPSGTLTKLDLSYNKITSLSSLQKFPKLIDLNVSCNLLVDVEDEITFISNLASSVEDIHLQGNPWKFEILIKPYAFYHLKCLKSIDGIYVSTSDRTQNAEVYDNSKINDSSICAVSTCSTILDDDYPFLTIKSVASFILDTSKFLYRPINKMIPAQITTLALENVHLTKLQNLSHLTNLRYASFNNNYIEKIEGLDDCPNLIELSIEYNQILVIDNIWHLKKLQRLLLGNNNIRTLVGSGFSNLSKLKVLSMRNNKIHKVCGVELCRLLRELYLGNNKIRDIKNILQLKNMSDLMILEFRGNPIVHTVNNYRLHVLYYLKQLKALDGEDVNTIETVQSKELFGGRLCGEYLMEKLSHDNFENLVRLDLPNCMLRSVEFLDPARFCNLSSVNLEKNQLSSFGGLVFLSKLKVLCLNENMITSLFPAQVNASQPNSGNSHEPNSIESKYAILYQSTEPVFPLIQVLHLARNGIRSLQSFQLHRMPKLRSLFLQQNELASITGIEGLNHLKEIVLDNNRIKNISEVSFLYNWTLQEIHLENNRLHELHNLATVENLKRLFVGGNRFNDPEDIEKFAFKNKSLVEISLIDCPIASRHAHRIILVHGISSLQYIDGIPVTDEERERSHVFYAEREMHEKMIQIPAGPPQTLVSKPISLVYDGSLPGIISQKAGLSTLKTFENNHSNNGKPNYSVVNLNRNSSHTHQISDKNNHGINHGSISTSNVSERSVNPPHSDSKSHYSGGTVSIVATTQSSTNQSKNSQQNSPGHMPGMIIHSVPVARDAYRSTRWNSNSKSTNQTDHHSVKFSAMNRSKK